jgi:hypothetical protein
MIVTSLVSEVGSQGRCPSRDDGGLARRTPAEKKEDRPESRGSPKKVSTGTTEPLVAKTLLNHEVTKNCYICAENISFHVHWYLYLLVNKYN